MGTNQSSIHGSTNNNISGRGSGSFNKFLSSRGNPTLKLICQVCTLIGHSAAVCHYPFDRSFQTPTSPPAAYFCDLDGCAIDYEPSAFTANTCPDFGVFEPTIWHADTGASHHIVSNSEAISDAHPYSVTGALMVSNGKKLSIHNIGSSVLTTSNHPLRLKTVL